jgi:hypothetical protein
VTTRIPSIQNEGGILISEEIRVKPPTINTLDGRALIAPVIRYAPPMSVLYTIFLSLLVSFLVSTKTCPKILLWDITNLASKGQVEASFWKPCPWNIASSGNTGRESHTLLNAQVLARKPLLWAHMNRAFGSEFIAILCTAHPFHSMSVLVVYSGLQAFSTVLSYGGLFHWSGPHSLVPFDVY